MIPVNKNPSLNSYHRVFQILQIGAPSAAPSVNRLQVRYAQHLQHRVSSTNFAPMKAWESSYIFAKTPSSHSHGSMVKMGVSWLSSGFIFQKIHAIFHWIMIMWKCPNNCLPYTSGVGALGSAPLEIQLLTWIYPSGKNSISLATCSASSYFSARIFYLPQQSRELYNN